MTQFTRGLNDKLLNVRHSRKYIDYLILKPFKSIMQQVIQGWVVVVLSALGLLVYQQGCGVRDCRADVLLHI